MRRPLYFGCWRQAGHYLFEQGMHSLGLGRDRQQERLMSFIDSTLCPPGEEIEGVANRTHLNFDGAPVTVLSFWDRSVDKRGACNSSFILPGVLDFTAAMAEAKRVFPEIFARFTFNIVEWKPTA